MCVHSEGKSAEKEAASTEHQDPFWEKDPESHRDSTFNFDTGHLKIKSLELSGG